MVEYSLTVGPFVVLPCIVLILNVFINQIVSLFICNRWF